MDNLIRVYDNVLTEEDCQRVITAFDDTAAKSFRVDNKTLYGGVGAVRDDTAMFFNESYPQAHEELHGKIKPYIIQYMSQFPVLDQFKLTSMDTKVQRTAPGGGYHVWHCEQSRLNPARVLVWSIFLNTIEEGGETEFLNQGLRFNPKAGTLLVFPAYWPWAHRGNPPLKQVKYIATGWFLDHGA